jgi:hypothetical protein
MYAQGGSTGRRSPAGIVGEAAARIARAATVRPQHAEGTAKSDPAAHTTIRCVGSVPLSARIEVAAAAAMSAPRNPSRVRIWGRAGRIRYMRVPPVGDCP